MQTPIDTPSMQLARDLEDPATSSTPVQEIKFDSTSIKSRRSIDPHGSHPSSSRSSYRTSRSQLITRPSSNSNPDPNDSSSSSSNSSSSSSLSSNNPDSNNSSNGSSPSVQSVSPRPVAGKRLPHRAQVNWDAFIHLVHILFKLSPHHQLEKALKQQQYHKGIITLSEITDTELINISYTSKTRGAVELSNASKSHLRVWKAFIHYRSANGDPVHLYNIVKIDPQEFTHFRQTIFPDAYTNGPIPPGPADKYKPTASTPADSFRKGIKRDPSLFTELKKDIAFNNWRRDTIATARSQGCSNVLDPSYKPITGEQKELFQLQNEYMYSVFIKTLLTDKGRELVRLHESDFNAQAIFSALIQFYTSNVVGQDKQTQLLTYLTSTRLGDGTWNGTTHAFVLHFQEQIRTYNRYAPKEQALPESMQLILLQNAVEEVQALAQVKANHQQLHVTQGVALSYTQYVQLLTISALQLDKKKPTAGSTRSRQRNVYSTDLNPYDIDTDISDLYHGETASYEANETVKVPTDRWSKLSPDGRQLWIKMTQSDRAAILGLPAPKGGPGPSAMITIDSCTNYTEECNICCLRLGFLHVTDRGQYLLRLLHSAQD